VSGQLIDLASGEATLPAETFDYVIVGSGAAGAAAARVLSDSGASIAIVEEGPVLSSTDFGDRAWPALRSLYREAGTLTARGRSPMPVLQGTCLGGSTVVNSGIVRRLPEAVWHEWDAAHGIGRALPYSALVRRWELLERELGTEETAGEILGRNSGLLAAGTQAAGVAAGAMQRFTRDCRGSARCSLGCPHGAKQSMLVTFLPYALAAGAVVIANARVERVAIERGRATGVEVRRPPNGHPAGRQPFRLAARKAVIVAASATATPLLLARSGIRSHHLGRHFAAHPGALVVGVFDRPVDSWSGATQGYEVDHYRESLRCKIESLSLPPDVLFSQLPGVGRRWVERIAQSGHMATWAVALRAEAEGTVRERRFLGTDIHYELTSRDVIRLRAGLHAAAELMFAAGAREVLPLVHGVPDALTSPDELPAIAEGPLDAACYSLTASHLFGTARMSVDPSDGVVGLDFAVHGLQDLFVVDSSVFPANIGVNPQHTIMAVAMHAAGRLAEGTR
jgi:choline dehydrogenase-like flavoprotein